MGNAGRKPLGVIFMLTFALIQSVLSGSSAQAMGRGRVVATVTPTPAPHTGVKTQPIEGADSCTSSDPNHICIGLKVVSYTKSGVPVLSKADAVSVTRDMSTIWAQCNIGYQLESYEQVDPATVGLNYDSNWQSDGDAIRATFNDNASFLVVTVGKLSGPTIGVTQMPGTGIYGSLIEDSYAHNSMTVGHELGHYQGLYHVSDAANLMYAYIGTHTSMLTADQCATARATDLANWHTLFRKN
jgi:hypothetical protein